MSWRCQRYHPRGACGVLFHHVGKSLTPAVATAPRSVAGVTEWRKVQSSPIWQAHTHTSLAHMHDPLVGQQTASSGGWCWVTLASEVGSFLASAEGVQVPGWDIYWWTGKAPMSLSGTQVLVNGEPASILYSSYGQVNLILPYSLTVATKPSIEVFSNGTCRPTRSLALRVQAERVTIFQVNNAAAALNQDGTSNSPQRIRRGRDRLWRCSARAAARTSRAVWPVRSRRSVCGR